MSAAPSRPPTHAELAAMPWWRRVAALRWVTRAGLWADAELLCVLAADGVATAAEHVERPLRRLGGRCYRRAAAARGRNGR